MRRRGRGPAEAKACNAQLTCNCRATPVRVPQITSIDGPHNETNAVLKAGELANLIEQHASLIVAALRAYDGGSANSDESGSPAMATQTTGAVGASTGTAPPTWVEVDLIDGFETKWPAPEVLRAQGHAQLHEHYGPMKVFEGRDEVGLARLAIGAPSERYEFYGRDRGWLSVWEVVNGRPARQLANFIEVDDFAESHDRAALISGKDGGAKKGFSPHERDLLPPSYDGMRVEVQRDRIVGPYSRKRLAVVARDEETDIMLNHALAHLRLRG